MAGTDVALLAGQAWVAGFLLVFLGLVFYVLRPKNPDTLKRNLPPEPED